MYFLLLRRSPQTATVDRLEGANALPGLSLRSFYPLQGGPPLRVAGYAEATENYFYIPFGGIIRIRFYGYNLSPLL